MSLETLVAKITSDNATERRDAWITAEQVGAPALSAMARVMAEQDTVDVEVARAAKNAMWRIVRCATRPDTDAKLTRAVIEALHPLLNASQPEFVRREVLWMLSEIGGDESVEPIAKVLADATLLEDARCALKRIPGEKSLSALGDALGTVPERFKSNIAQSLRSRGVEVDRKQFPCEKLVPTKETAVQPVG